MNFTRQKEQVYGAPKGKTTHEVKTTTDPGRALITGLWKEQCN